MDEQSWSWVKGCAVGCGALVLLAVVLSTVGVVRILRPFQSAVDARAELESTVGTEDSFTPSPDGAIDPARIDDFLAVRAALVDTCARLTESTAAMARMEELDRQENPSRMEVLRLAVAATRGAMGMGPLMGELFERRNEQLLDAGMGLGEYSYLYVVSYRDQLVGDRPRTWILDGSPVNARIHATFEGMLARQLEAARAAELAPDWIAELEREHAAVASDFSRIPWQDGLPKRIGDSLAPYAEQLGDTFCAAATEVELLRNVRRGLAIESQ